MKFVYLGISIFCFIVVGLIYPHSGIDIYVIIFLILGGSFAKWSWQEWRKK